MDLDEKKKINKKSAVFRQLLCTSEYNFMQIHIRVGACWALAEVCPFLSALLVHILKQIPNSSSCAREYCSTVLL